jgi:acyl dehydratase
MNKSTTNKQPRWAFEDFRVGDEIDLGSKTVSAEEIIEFARQFDPQPMHLSEEAGRESILGGLSASGFHTASIFMRMMCDAYLLDSTSQGAPGVEYMNWRKPVLAGDMLTGTTRCLEKRRSKSRPDMGIVTVHHEMKNQRGEIVCELRNSGMFTLRNPDLPS